MNSYRLPRVRGDLPVQSCSRSRFCQSPPRARGSTLVNVLFYIISEVSPACAGIYLTAMFLDAKQVRLPRVRGDLPWEKNEWIYEELSPPRARGSTL